MFWSQWTFVVCLHDPDAKIQYETYIFTEKCIKSLLSYHYLMLSKRFYIYMLFYVHVKTMFNYRLQMWIQMVHLIYLWGLLSERVTFWRRYQEVSILLYNIKVKINVLNHMHCVCSCTTRYHNYVVWLDETVIVYWGTNITGIDPRWWYWFVMPCHAIDQHPSDRSYKINKGHLQVRPCSWWLTSVGSFMQVIFAFSMSSLLCVRLAWQGDSGAVCCMKGKWKLETKLNCD